MGGRCKAPCLKWQKQIKTNNNPCKPSLRAGTEAICTRAEARKSSFDSVLNHNKDYCCWEDGGEGRRGDAEGNKRNRGYLAGLSGALSAGVICRDVWNRADNKREKWAPQEQRLEAEQLTMHSLHAVFAVPHSKCSPSVRCDRCWFHMAHLTEKRPTGMSSEDKFLLSLGLLWRMMAKLIQQRMLWAELRGQMLPCKTCHGSAGMGLSSKEWSTHSLIKDLQWIQLWA